MCGIGRSGTATGCPRCCHPERQSFSAEGIAARCGHVINEAKKRRRQAASMWLRCVDKALINATGAGLKKLQQPTDPAERADPLEWPGLSISCDQEAAGHHAVQAAQTYLNLNVDYVPDPSHGGNRVIQDALKKAGLWPYKQSMMITRNIPHGPWSEDMRFRQSQQIMAEHISNTHPSECHMFQALAVSMTDHSPKKEGR